MDGSMWMKWRKEKERCQRQRRLQRQHRLDLGHLDLKRRQGGRKNEPAATNGNVRERGREHENEYDENENVMDQRRRRR